MTNVIFTGECLLTTNAQNSYAFHLALLMIQSEAVVDQRLSLTRSQFLQSHRYWLDLLVLSRKIMSPTLVVPRHSLSSYGRRTFAVAGPTAWNSLNDDLRDPTLSTDSFRRLLETRLLPARRYASAGYRDRNVSVCPSVRHAPVLCQNEES